MPSWSCVGHRNGEMDCSAMCISLGTENQSM